jgi:hypothetical protein
MIRHSDVEALVHESQRLRDELMRTASRLEVFAEQLLTETVQLREAMDDDDGTGRDRRADQDCEGSG